MVFLNLSFISQSSLGSVEDFYVTFLLYIWDSNSETIDFSFSQTMNLRFLSGREIWLQMIVSNFFQTLSLESVNCDKEIVESETQTELLYVILTNNPGQSQSSRYVEPAFLGFVCRKRCAQTIEPIRLKRRVLSNRVKNMINTHNRDKFEEPSRN